MKPSKPDAAIPKFRVSLSIPQMDSLIQALSKDPEVMIQEIELVALLKKAKRKAEFGVIESSHSSSNSTSPSAKVEKIMESVKEDSKAKCFEIYSKFSDDMPSDQILKALQYKMENPIECGALTDLEQEILNEEMTKQLMGGL